VSLNNGWLDLKFDNSKKKAAVGMSTAEVLKDFFSFDLVLINQGDTDRTVINDKNNSVIISATAFYTMI